MIAVLGPHRGVHRGDLYVLAAWLVGVLAVVVATGLAGRRSRD